MKITYIRRANTQIIANGEPNQQARIGVANQISTNHRQGTKHVDSIELQGHVYILRTKGMRTIILPVAQTYHAEAEEDVIADEKPAKKAKPAAVA